MAPSPREGTASLAVGSIGDAGGQDPFVGGIGVAGKPMCERGRSLDHHTRQYILENIF